MQSLKETAQLAYNRVYPNASADAPHDIEEFVLTAKQKYGYLQWKFYLDGRNDPDIVFVELLLKTKKLKVETDDDGRKFVQLENEILDLPQDAGVYAIPGYVKTSRAKMDLFSFNRRTKPRYYREGDRIYFPFGFVCDNDPAEIEVSVISVGELDEDDIFMSEAMADLVREGVVAAYMGTAGRAEDKEADRNPNTSIQK